MLSVIIASLLLVALTIVIHYEVLRALNDVLPALRVPARSKLLVVIFATFFAHALEIAVYGAVIFVLIEHMGVGSLGDPAVFSLLNCMYFSAETYTSLGLGDLTPAGSVRLIAGVEALNGLLLIGWSASYTYLAMERFWNEGKAERR